MWGCTWTCEIQRVFLWNGWESYSTLKFSSLFLWMTHMPPVNSILPQHARNANEFVQIFNRVIMHERTPTIIFQWEKFRRFSPKSHYYLTIRFQLTLNLQPHTPGGFQQKLISLIYLILAQTPYVFHHHFPSLESFTLEWNICMRKTHRIEIENYLLFNFVNFIFFVEEGICRLRLN